MRHGLPLTDSAVVVSRRAATDAYKAKNTDLGENEMAIFESLSGETLRTFLDPLASTFSIHCQIH